MIVIIFKKGHENKSMLHVNMQHTDSDKLFNLYCLTLFWVGTGTKFLQADLVTVLILMKNASGS